MNSKRYLNISILISLVIGLLVWVLWVHKFTFIFAKIELFSNKEVILAKLIITGIVILISFVVSWFLLKPGEALRKRIYLIAICLIALVISLYMSFVGFALSLSFFPPFSPFTGIIVMPLITFVIVVAVLMIELKLSLKGKRVFDIFKKNK